MKKIYYVIVALAASFAVSCAPEFNEEYAELRMDFTEMTVPASEESALLKIYYSGSWTVSLPDDVSWAEIEKTSGSGITGNHVLLKQNDGPVRSTDITVKADNGQEWIVKLNQSAVSDRLYLQFETDRLELPADAFDITLPVVSNLGESYVASMFEDFVPETLSGIITGYELSEPEVKEAGYSRRMVSFSLAGNTSGAARTIELMADLDGYDLGDTLRIVQGTEAAQLSVKDIPDDGIIVSGVAGSYSFEIEHNLGSLADSVRVAAAGDFISDVALDGNVVSYSVSALPEGSDDRTARLTIGFSAYGVTGASVTVDVTQVKLIEREKTVSQLLERFDAENEYTADDNIHSDYITLYVVGGAGNPNMDQNINLGPNVITTEENDKTLYMQDALENPTRGFRVKFSDSADNTLLRHGDCVKLFLTGRTLHRETAPERYTIGALNASSVEVVSSGNAVVPARRTIASLSPADIYTYCTLENVEFQVKEGAYTNVREYAAIRNPLTSGDMGENYLDTGRENSKLETAAQFAMDGAANLLYDNAGDAIYALINMGCEWRRAQVPSGSGNLSGVVVHQEMPRWGGNVGTYSIRPLGVGDIDMNSASGWNTLAEWVLVKKTTDYKQYEWEGGYSGKQAAVLKQNKMKATNGADAVIYSENLNGLTTKTNLHGKGATPVSVEYGYRGLDMSSPDKAENYGMSVGSAFAFWGNACGWFNWDGSTRTDGFNGIVMEFSSRNASGSQMSVGFSIAAGYPNSGKPRLNIALQSSTSFPVYWTVEYSVGDSDVWTSVQNEATSVEGFQMRSLPWTLDGTITYVPHNGTTSKIEVQTQSDTGFGLVPYRFNLPSSALGQDKVKVRIRPTSAVVMTLNAVWNAGLTSAGLEALAQPDQKTNVNHGVVLEDVMIQYR